MRSLLFIALTLIALVTGRYVRPRQLTGIGQTANRTRFFIYIQKNPNLTFTEFSDYWRGPHAKLFLGTEGVKKNILRYEQLHVNQEWKRRLRQDGFSVPDWDGVMIAEGTSIDTILTAFNNKEYNETVLPDVPNFGNPTTGLTGAVKINPVIDQHPDHADNFPEGVIRKDVQTLVADFSSKPGQAYPEFVKYWTNVNTPKFIDILSKTGEDRKVLKYELNTLDPVKPTVGNPFPSFTEWDAVAMVNGRNIGDLEDILKNRKIVNFIKEDAPNFADVKKGIEFIPCDVVSFKIPKV